MAVNKLGQSMIGGKAPGKPNKTVAQPSGLKGSKLKKGLK